MPVLLCIQKALTPIKQKEIANLWHNIREVPMEGIKAEGTQPQGITAMLQEKKETTKNIF